MSRGTSKKGFTLIEVIVSLAIVMIIFAFLFPVLSGSKEMIAKTDLKKLSSYTADSIANCFAQEPEAFITDPDTALTFYLGASGYCNLTLGTEGVYIIEIKFDQKLQPLLFATSTSSLIHRIEVHKENVSGVLYRYTYNAVFVDGHNEEYYRYPEKIEYKEVEGA